MDYVVWIDHNWPPAAVSCGTAERSTLALWRQPTANARSAGASRRLSKALNLEQAKAVLTAECPSRLYAYLSLLRGVRTEEARPLTWDHVFP